MKLKIAAGIVMYNPESKKRLTECLENLLKQIDRVYIFDNSTEKIELLNQKKITYITENKNRGIAYALNRIISQAEKDGYNWVITMDQDSIVPHNLVAEFSKYCSDDENIGIVCPQVIDYRRAYMNIVQNPRLEYVEDCITSGSCTSIKAWRKIGGFDEWLFIDLVDNEFCKRLIASNYKILRVNEIVLNQEFGKIVAKSMRKQKFWIKVSHILNNENFAKFSYKKYVSPMRVYYTCRNIIYVNKKMKKYGKTAFSNYNCQGYIGFWISFCVPSLLRAQNKIKVLKSMFKGTIDGMKVNVEPWNGEI